MKEIQQKRHTILGAIAGDVIGSVYEWNNCKSVDCELYNKEADFTDDSVLTVAIADAIIHKKDFAKTVWQYGNHYAGRGYGGRFSGWLASKDLQPYNSFGNGSAMRVSAVGFAYDTIEKVLEIAEKTASITHNHSEGIKGAQAISGAIFLARKGKSKQEIKSFIEDTFSYSDNYEHAIRLALSIGGDSDTIACMVGGIATAYYEHIPEKIVQFVEERLPKEFLDIIAEFATYLNNVVAN